MVPSSRLRILSGVERVVLIKQAKGVLQSPARMSWSKGGTYLRTGREYSYSSKRLFLWLRKESILGRARRILHSSEECLLTREFPAS